MTKMPAKSAQTHKKYKTWEFSYEKIKTYYDEKEQRLIVPQSDHQLISWMAINRSKYAEGTLSQEK